MIFFQLQSVQVWRIFVVVKGFVVNLRLSGLYYASGCKRQIRWVAINWKNILNILNSFGKATGFFIGNFTTAKMFTKLFIFLIHLYRRFGNFRRKICNGDVFWWKVSLIFHHNCIRIVGIVWFSCR